MARRQLRDIKLVGIRAVIRGGMIAGVALLCAIGAVAYTLPAHRLEEDRELGFHNLYVDGGPLPFVIFALVAASCWAVRRSGHGAGYVLGAISATGAMFATASVFLSHLMIPHDETLAEPLYFLTMLGLFGLGILLLIVEPILYIGQRRQLERDVDPRFPTARMIRS